ncbi:hypothetical protein M885DRAFT_543905 [Pelagophyceae sp. CCMP2097]|nr:hypothetical protein M885DRAFT_543905 [Pelagophyceae sp. CCMP2097]
MVAARSSSPVPKSILYGPLGPYVVPLSLYGPRALRRSFDRPEQPDPNSLTKARTAPTRSLYGPIRSHTNSRLTSWSLDGPSTAPRRSSTVLPGPNPSTNARPSLMSLYSPSTVPVRSSRGLDGPKVVLALARSLYGPYTVLPGPAQSLDSSHPSRSFEGPP